MNLKSNQKGFTIVELLIVIVVIAILAAISIVAFTGIQQRGRDSAKASDASNIVKALTAYTTDGEPWPINASAASAELAAYPTANLSPEITGKITGTTAPTANTDQYSYLPCGSSAPYTGARIVYWSEQDGGTRTVTAGTGCPSS